MTLGKHLLRIFLPWVYYRGAVADALNQALNPEFGWIWMPDSSFMRAIDTSRTLGYHEGYAKGAMDTVGNLPDVFSTAGHRKKDRWIYSVVNLKGKEAEPEAVLRTLRAFASQGMEPISIHSNTEFTMLDKIHDEFLTELQPKVTIYFRQSETISA